MSRFRVLFGWPGPVWLFPASGAMMAIGTALVTRSMLAAAYPRWSSVSTAWHESLWFTGSLAAGGAAALGFALFTRNSVVVNPIRSGVNASLFLKHGAALGLWLVAGHTAGMMPAVIQAAGGATAGTLSVQDVVVGTVGLMLLAVIGFCAGSSVRHWVVGPGVAVLFIVVMALPGYNLGQLGLFFPVRQFIAGPRFELNPPTTLFSVVAAVVVGSAAISLAWWITARATVRGGGVNAGIWVASSIALVAVAFAWRPELYVVDRPVPQQCEQVNGAEVCIHGANIAAMEETVAVVGDLQAVGLAPLLERVTDFSAAEFTEPEPGEAFVSFSPGSTLNGTIRQQVAGAVSAAMTTGYCDPFAAGSTNSDGALTEETSQNIDTAGAVQKRALQLAGFDGAPGDAIFIDSTSPAANAILAMNAEELAAYIESHLQQIKNCQLTGDDTA